MPPAETSRRKNQFHGAGEEPICRHFDIKMSVDHLVGDGQQII